MSLWDLLIVVSSSAFVGGALAAARVTNGGVRNYLVATITGVLLAIANAWTWSKVAGGVDRHIKGLSESDQERYLRLLYLAATIWILCAGAAGIWIALRVLRLVS
jgi:hypothetical protein